MTSLSAVLRRLSALALASVFVAGLVVAAVPASALAEEFDGIGGGPATATGADPTRSRFSYQLEPGQQIADQYQVQNIGDTVQAMTVYATDAFTSGDGSYSLLEGAAEPKEVGSWVRFTGGVTRVTLTLKPGASQILPFTLKVPADAGPGDHAGGILVSAVSETGEVNLDRRVGTRLYARIKGELQAGLTITSIAASYTPDFNPFVGRTAVTYTVTNNGNVALGANVVAKVGGLFGIPLVERSTSTIPEMLPGESRTMASNVTGVGQWVFLNPVVDLAATIDTDALNPGPLPSAQRDTTLFVVPWMLVGLIVLAGLTWLIARLSRHRNNKRALAWVEYTEAEARRNARTEQGPTS